MVNHRPDTMVGVKGPIAIATGLLALVLVATACDGPAATPASRSPETSPTETIKHAPPPTPAEALGLETGWGPTQDELERAARQALRMPLGDLAGQVIVASYAGTRAPVRMVKVLLLGGVVAFADNIVDSEQIGRVNHTLARQVGRPLVISVDQEGGLVERVGGARFPAFMAAGAADDEQLTQRSYRAMGARLAALGFTLDFAPDADVTEGPADPTIGSRSAGDDPTLVARQAIAAADGLRTSGVIPVLKHVPGHGSVPANSHLTLPVQTRDLDWLRTHDLVPFAEAADAGQPVIMVGHIAVQEVNPHVPASLSGPLIQGVLRREEGFDGVVVTDSLQMKGVQVPGALPPVVRALRAGADLVLMPPSAAGARAAIVHAVRTGDLSRTRLRQAAARTLALLEHRAAAAPRPPTPTAAARAANLASRRLSAAAITSVAGPCRGPLVSGEVVPIGDATAAANFRIAAEAAGLPLGSVEHVKAPKPKRHHASKKKYQRRLDRWRDTPPTVVIHGTPIRLLGPSAVVVGRVAGPVVVTTGTPYPLGQTSARIRLAAWGNAPGPMQALVAVLQGRAKASGRLPVEVAGVRRGC
jgi:beta-N-acetylhexosaminidase